MPAWLVAGFQLAYTFSGVVLALAQVLLPFTVLSLYGVIRAIDPELERAAQNIGAGPLRAVLLTLRCRSPHAASSRRTARSSRFPSVPLRRRAWSAAPACS